VITHGFVVAGDGRKMSKSLGNTVDPQNVMNRDGADVLRLWVASLDYTNDDPLSEEILKRTAEAYRKIRNTVRFLLSNLFEFEPRHAVPDAALEPLDRWILDRAARLADETKLGYERYEFHAVARQLLEFATTDLSAIWCDIRKDAFYVLAANDPVRRSAQTAAAKLAETVALLLSPICPFTAEEIWENIPGREDGNLFVETYECARLPRLESPAVEAWERLLLLRGVIQTQLEPLRRDGKVGSSAQAAVEIAPNAELDADLARVGLPLSKLAEFLNMPEVVRVNSAPEGPSPSLPFYGGLSLLVRPAEGVKCPRCWQVRRDVEPGGVCARCRGVIGPEPLQSAS
jgi:isoleucyl-tRNA synthetase